jgi:opacity protein-like surface antigen
VLVGIFDLGALAFDACRVEVAGRILLKEGFPMRSLLVLCAVVSVLALTAGMANAANPGQVPNSTLAQLGLSGMQPMSDVQGTDIRGMGFVVVSGYALATTYKSTAVAGYVAGATGSTAFAVGGDIAIATKGPIFCGGVVAGGGAIAGIK